MSQHIIQRGTNRTAMFRAAFDYCLFLDLLRRDAEVCGVDIHGYVLMTTHVHIMATPSAPSGVPELMQRIGRTYVLAFNKRYGRTGGLWEGRYRSSLIRDEKYWLTCLRYIELNPVRAGIVASPDLYDWSSYRAHALGRPDSILKPHPLLLAEGRTDAERQRAWRATCGVQIDDESLITIRQAIQASRPLRDGLPDIQAA